jgi:hypothetical protein
MKNIRIQNPRLSEEEKTYLTNHYTAGVSLTVENGEGFTTNDYVVVGAPGREKTEQGLATAATALTITLSSALSFTHTKDNRVYRTKYNQYALQYRTSSTGTWTALTTSDIEWDQTFSEYEHSAGTDDYQYRYRFYNATSGVYSDYSDTIEGTGFGKSSVGYLIERVRLFGKDPDGKIATDDEIIGWFNDGQQEVQSAFPNWWFLLKDDTSTTRTTVVAGDSTYALPTDFGRMESVRFRYISTTSTSTSTTTTT